MSEHILRFRAVSPDEVLPEESVLKKEPGSPFLGPGDRPEPYLTLYIAAARMKQVFERTGRAAPFIVHTPRGDGLLWRWWPSQIGVVLFTSAGTGSEVEPADRVTFLEPHEREHVTLDLSRIVLNAPKWS